MNHRLKPIDVAPVLHPSAEAKNSAVQQCLHVLQRLTGLVRPADFSVRFWDGTAWEPENGVSAIYFGPPALRRFAQNVLAAE